MYLPKSNGVLLIVFHLSHSAAIVEESDDSDCDELDVVQDEDILLVQDEDAGDTAPPPATPGPSAATRSIVIAVPLPSPTAPVDEVRR